MTKPAFESIDTALHVKERTWAELKMPNGRVYKAVWAQIGNVTAWWPDDKRRRSPIGLYDPVEWRRL